MKRRWVSIGVLIILVAAVAAAQPAPPPQNPQKLLADYLQLSDQQIAEWKQIQQDTAATVKPLADTIRSLEDQLHTALQAATPDANAVGKLVIQIEQTREQIKAARDAAGAKRLATLNADQKVKYQAFQAAVQFLQEHGPGPHGPGPSGE